MLRHVIFAITTFILAGCDGSSKSPTASSVPAEQASHEEEEVAAGRITGRKKVVHDGPFGLRPSLSKHEIEAMFDLEALPDSPGVYYTEHVPSPHNAFEGYILVLGDKTGLCKVRGIGKSFQTGDAGIEIRSNFATLSDALTEKYGQGELTDIHTGGGTGNSQYWTMNLAMKDRIYTKLWTEKTGADLPENLIGVALEAQATGTNTGYLTLGYEFSNFELCMKEIAAIANVGL